MAYTQAQLDALKAAYASGLLEVDYNGRRMRYQSRNEMRGIIAEIEAELTPSTATPSRTVGAFSSGLQSGVIDSRPGWRRC